VAIIDTEEAAKRLARVILSDIELYNRQKIQAGESLETEIEAGLALFRKRVIPELVPVFAEVMKNSRRAGTTEATKAEPLSGAQAAVPEQNPVSASAGVFERPPENTPSPLAAATFVANGEDLPTPPQGTVVPGPREDRVMSRPEPLAAVVASPVAAAPGRPVVLHEGTVLEHERTVLEEEGTPTPLPPSVAPSRQPPTLTRLPLSVGEPKTSEVISGRGPIDPARPQFLEDTDLRPRRSKTRALIAVAAAVLAAALIYHFR
jgi:hypothetical protein